MERAENELELGYDPFELLDGNENYLKGTISTRVFFSIKIVGFQYLPNLPPISLYTI